MKKQNRQILFDVLLAGEILFLMFLAWRFGSNNLNADKAAEMILSEQLAREGHVVFSPNWYYSTEIRVLNIQIVMGFLFRFFSNWNTVRTLGTMILLVILAISYLYLCHSMPSSETVRWTVLLLLWPFSRVYQDIVIYGLYYIPHLSIIFLTLGLFLRLQQRHTALHAILLFLLSFAAGMGGFRMVVICYAVLPAGCILLDLLEHCLDKDSFRTALVSFIFACMGLLVNHFVLCRVLHCTAFSSLALQMPQLSRIAEVIRHVPVVLGVELPGRGILQDSASLLSLIACFLFLYMGICIAKNWQELFAEEKFLFCFFPVSYLLTASSAVFIQMSWTARYLIMSCSGFLFLVPVYYRLERNRQKKRIISVFVVLSMFYSGTVQLYKFVSKSTLTSAYNIIRVLEEENIHFGFGDWGYSDQLTELSNGSIYMAKINNWKEFHIWDWLMDVNYEERARQGKIFVLISHAHLNFDGGESYLYGEWTADDLTYLQAGKAIYQDDQYTIREYDSYEQLLALLGE